MHMSLRQILATSRGRATVACDLLALTGMAPFVAIEVSGSVVFKQRRGLDCCQLAPAGSFING